MPFVLPEQGRFKVTVGGSVITADSRQVAWKYPYPNVTCRDKLPLLHFMPQMHEATFNLNTLRYELWPLRQWRLSPDLALKFKVMVRNDRGDAALL